MSANCFILIQLSLEKLQSDGRVRGSRYNKEIGAV
jgi:hypothetical protein